MAGLIHPNYNGSSQTVSLDASIPKEAKQNRNRFLDREKELMVARGEGAAGMDKKKMVKGNKSYKLPVIN